MADTPQSEQNDLAAEERGQTPRQIPVPLPKKRGRPPKGKQAIAASDSTVQANSSPRAVKRRKQAHEWSPARIEKERAMGTDRAAKSQMLKKLKETKEYKDADMAERRQLSVAAVRKHEGERRSKGLAAEVKLPDALEDMGDFLSGEDEEDEENEGDDLSEHSSDAGFVSQASDEEFEFTIDSEDSDEEGEVVDQSGSEVEAVADDNNDDETDEQLDAIAQNVQRILDRNAGYGNDDWGLVMLQKAYDRADAKFTKSRKHSDLLEARRRQTELDHYIASPDVKLSGQ